MPELPEVETTLRGILPHIIYQKISKTIVREHRFRQPIPMNMGKILLNKEINHVERRGKYLLFKTIQGTLLIHLGMSGHLRILINPPSHGKHDHVDILFHHQKILRFTDPRRFGLFLWLEGDPYQHPLLKDLGMEPLVASFTGRYLWHRAQNRKLPIKSFLMDNKIVTGIGNIYATEALFDAEIHPLTPARSLSVERLDTLVKSSKQILRQAIKHGGTTLKDFINSEGKPGYFSNQLQVYGRVGLPCYRCHNPLQLMSIGQRSTVYCQYCQQY